MGLPAEATGADVDWWKLPDRGDEHRHGRWEPGRGRGHLAIGPEDHDHRAREREADGLAAADRRDDPPDGMGRRIPARTRPADDRVDTPMGSHGGARPSARPGDSCSRGRRPGHRRGRRPTCPARARPPSTCTARSAAWPRVVSDSRETVFADGSWGPASTTCMLSSHLVEGDSMAPVVIPIRSRLRQGSRSASLTTLEESPDTGRIPARRMRDQRGRFAPAIAEWARGSERGCRHGRAGPASSRMVGPAVQITDANDVLGEIPGQVDGRAGRSRQPVHQDFQTQGDEMEKDCGAAAREMAALLHERLLRARDGIVGGRSRKVRSREQSAGRPRHRICVRRWSRSWRPSSSLLERRGARPDLRGLRPRPGSRDVRGGPRRPHGGRSADPLRRVLRRLTSDIAIARRRVGTGARGPGSRRRVVSNADRTARPGGPSSEAAVNPPANRIPAGGGTVSLPVVGLHRRGESSTRRPDIAMQVAGPAGMAGAACWSRGMPEVA